MWAKIKPKREIMDKEFSADNKYKGNVYQVRLTATCEIGNLMMSLIGRGCVIQ